MQVSAAFGIILWLMILNRGGGSKRGFQEGAGYPQFSEQQKLVHFQQDTIKVCNSCSRQVPGTFASRAAHLMVSLDLCTSGRIICIEVEGPWRALCQLKKLDKGLRPSCWKEQILLLILVPNICLLVPPSLHLTLPLSLSRRLLLEIDLKNRLTANWSLAVSNEEMNLARKSTLASY